MINKNNNECETQACNYPKIRTRFYNGMLLTDQHLRDEQEYHREKLKSVNRHLYGAGIVCGLKVTAPKVGLCIKIDPGVALDCCGNLIEVCKCISLDLSKLCKEKYGQGCIQDPADPAPRIITKNLVLSYAEKESDPEPVLTPAADCRSAGEESKCQQSKVREGYCIELWDEDKCPCMETKRGGVKPEGNPKTGGDVPNPPNSEEARKAETEKAMMQTRTAIEQKTWEDVLEAFLEENPLPCYPCGCCKNSVGLATLEIDCAANTVKVEKTCRTYVLTPRLVRWLISSNWAKVDSIVTKIQGASRQPVPSHDMEVKSEETTEAEAQADPLEAKTSTKKPAASKKGATTTTSEKPAAETADTQPLAAEDTKK